MVNVMEDAYRLFQQLPDDLKEEVLDYIEFLLERNARRRRSPMKFGWRGGLKELRKKYTSVELQHKALEWWG